MHGGYFVVVIWRIHISSCSSCICIVVLVDSSCIVTRGGGETARICMPTGSYCSRAFSQLHWEYDDVENDGMSWLDGCWVTESTSGIIYICIYTYMYMDIGDMWWRLRLQVYIHIPVCRGCIERITHIIIAHEWILVFYEEKGK